MTPEPVFQSPLHEALIACVDAMAYLHPPSDSSRAEVVWESWKQAALDKAAKALDALPAGGVSGGPTSDFETLRVWVAEHLAAIDLDDEDGSAAEVLSSLDHIVSGSAGCTEESDYTPERWRVLMLCKGIEPDGGSGDGVALIAAERKRQVAAEGWTVEHDDEHTGGELALAGACYAIPADRSEVVEFATTSNLDGSRVPALWPWEHSWYKRVPYDRVRELVKAGALIAAEIDRLGRLP